MRQFYPDHQGQLARLARIEGQLGGVRRMIEERRYCIDILSQIKAVVGALKQVELGVLETHMHHCVKDAVEAGDAAELEAKVAELVKVLGRIE